MKEGRPDFVNLFQDKATVSQHYNQGVVEHAGVLMLHHRRGEQMVLSLDHEHEEA